MSMFERFKDVFRRKKSRDFAKELAYQFYSSPLCSDYENLFAQVRPLIDEMKIVMPYAVSERGKKLTDKQAPELAWLKNPNDDMGWAEFADLMFATWLTEDELDVHVWKNQHDKIVGYTVLPPQSRVYLGNGYWQWQVMTNSGVEILDDKEVMRLRFSRSPRNPERGVSPASAVRIWAQVDDLVSQYQKAYFENGAIPATITFITASTEDKYNATRHELERGLKGASNRNKTVYAWRQFDNDSGASVDQVEVKPIQGSNSTMAIKEIVEIVNDRLNKSIGVSNFILGDDSSAKYDNAELSDHQFTKRRVYPALLSFWNQFQHELDRITGGLGYAISFDLEIPELTERAKVRAEIARVQGESLVNLIEAGADAEGAIKALGLDDSWRMAAGGIWAKSVQNPQTEPVAISYGVPKAVEATVDMNYVGKHTRDVLPEMSADEKKIYDLLVEFGKALLESKKTDVYQLIDKMTEICVIDANNGAEDGAKALEMLADKDVAGEIAKEVTDGEVHISQELTDKISDRAERLARGYEDFTKSVMDEVLNNTKGMTANEIKRELAKVLPTSRAELIARNEVNYAIKSGRLEQDRRLAEKYGLKIDIIWRTSDDENVCGICEAMEGHSVELGKAFPDHVATEDGEIGWEHSVWNDHGEIPDAHPNCRCYFDEVLA